MLRSLLAAGFLVRLGAAQQSGWQAHQVNSTMCYWDSPRAAVVRDTLYVDGGILWWAPGMDDGSVGPPTSDDNPLGIVYQLNFSTPFKTTGQNLSTVFTTQSKAPANGAANNVAPNYYDGAMLANDFEWFIYAGLLLQTAEYTLPGKNAAAAYEVYASGPPKQFHAGYVAEVLPDGVTRYVTNGAGVSVPSENLGFYFSGLRSSTFDQIFYGSNETFNADVVSTTLIELDMTNQDKPIWKNTTLPTSVPGRVNAELVWVPVSKQGILVAIGGVVDPEFAYVGAAINSSQIAENKLKSPAFMQTVDVYDIATGSWYRQPTSETPPPALTQGCTVLASARDGSSHNIYWYGGWDGYDNTDQFNDDVWILSIPSFVWMKVHSGTSTHGRAGHRCTKPYPDQMFVIGGYASLTGNQPHCVEGGIIQIFNLSSVEWITKYDPNAWSNYTVPSMIVDKIGGSGTGSATMTAPTPSGFANSSMTPLFGTPYNMSKVTTWYPYHAAATPTLPPNITTITSTPSPKSSGTPSYLAPVLGVVLGLFFLTLLVVAFLLWRRRHLFRSSAAGGQSENGTMDNRRWVTNWLRATPADAKAPTVTTDETPNSPYDDDRHEMAEMQGQQVYEMMDTSQLVELGATDTGTGLHPIPVANSPASRSRNIKSNKVAPSSSVTSATSQSSALSHVSHDPSFVNPTPSSQTNSDAMARPPVSPVHGSPTLGSAGAGVGGERIVSGISNMSESDRGHLRGISETSVSTDGGLPVVTPMETPGMGNGLGTASSSSAGGSGIGDGKGGMISPLTPPPVDAKDYLGVKDAGGKESPTSRRSNFSEELGEGGEKK